MVFKYFVLYALFVFVGLQTFVADNLGISFVSYSDELFVFVCIFLLIVQSIYRQSSNPIFLGMIVIFLVLTFLSGFGLTKSWTQAVVGYFDIYKNFFMVLALPLLLRLVGVSSQNIVSLLRKFIYSSIVFTVFFYLFPTSMLNSHQDQIRMGIYRLSGFVSDINSYAFILMLLLFSVQTNFIQISNKRVISAILFLLIFLTFSRTTMFMAVAGVVLVNTQSIKKLFFYVSAASAMFVAMSIYDARTLATADVASQEFVWNPISNTEISDNFGETQYRMTVYLKSFQMFLESPLIGHGLGTFGTPISLIEKSPLYVKYGFPQVEFVEGGFNVQDAYYPIIYVQSGLIGVFLFGITSFSVLVRYRNSSEKLFFILAYVSIVLLSLNSMTFMVGSLMFFYSLFIAISELRYIERREEAGRIFQSTKLLEYK